MSVSPIELAVLPMKQDAIHSADLRAQGYVQGVKEKLATAGWDLEKVAPYPRASGMSKKDYMSALANHQMYASLTKWGAATRRPHDPCYVDMDEKKVLEFIEQRKRDAAAQYDAFVIKLVEKVGNGVVLAKISGNHIWGSSILTVQFADGRTEWWHTQQITNVSKYWKFFNQWPSRKMKSVHKTLAMPSEQPITVHNLGNHDVTVDGQPVKYGQTLTVFADGRKELS